MADPTSLLDATAQADLVRRGEATPLELVDAAIARIESLDSQLGAVITRQLERARAQALSPELPDGGFRGVPFLLKDLGAHLAGDPVRSGMAILKRIDWREPGESYFAAKLCEAGFIVLGRTNTPELGLLPATEPEAYGATRNPWKPTHSPGGSSGGSAAAVAAGYVPAAHASDGGGSIRIPASHCGLVGLKPSRGRNSFGPDLGERWAGFSTEGALTRTVRDTAAILDITAGPMPGDPYSTAPPARPFAAEVGADPGRLLVGLMRTAPRDGETHPDCVAAVTGAAQLLEAAGHAVEESSPEALQDPEAMKSFLTVVASSTAFALDAWSRRIGAPIGEGDVEALTWALAESGRGMSAPQYIAAVNFNHAYSRRVASWWEGGFDLLLTPVCAAPPPPLGHFAPPPENPLQAFLRAAPYSVFTSHFNVTGQPAISLPLHWNEEGLPVGVQLVAAAGREDLLLRAAAQLERAQPWTDRIPPVHAFR
jgi:amidase